MKKYFLFLLLSTIFVSSSFAQSINPNPSCPRLTSNFAQGATDAKTSGQVTELQKFFKSYYYLNDNQLVVTGSYGAVTTKFVKFFQKTNSISQTGSIGPATRARILSKCNSNQGPINYSPLPQSQSSTGTTCNFNGQTYSNGQSVIAFQHGTVTDTSQCRNEVRSCNNGVMTGSYAYTTCKLQGQQTTQTQTTTTSSTNTNSGTQQTQTSTNTSTTNKPCTQDGQVVQHGSSYTFYQYKTVTSPTTCSGIQSRNCNNGNLSGSTIYQYSSCTQTQVDPGTFTLSFTPSSVSKGSAVTITWTASKYAASDLIGLVPSGTTPSASNYKEYFNITGTSGTKQLTVNTSGTYDIHYFKNNGYVSSAKASGVLTVIEPGGANNPIQATWTTSATDKRGKNNQQFVYSCPATSDALSSVYGSGIYTDDSRICVAAVHAGVITKAGGNVTITILPGQSSYEKTTNNGITTIAYTSYYGSYSIVGANYSTATSGNTNTGSCSNGATNYPSCNVCSGQQILQNGQCVNQVTTGTPSNPIIATLGTDARDKAGKNEQQFTYTCPAISPNDVGSVWGTNIYTHDSPICKAAMHAGVLRKTGGTVTIIIKPGQSAYQAAYQNGISSSSYGSYSGSYTFVGIDTDTSKQCKIGTQSFTNGNSVTMYKDLYVPTGTNCVSEERVCNNGVITGSYTNYSCTQTTSTYNISFSPSSIPAVSAVTINYDVPLNFKGSDFITLIPIGTPEANFANKMVGSLSLWSVAKGSGTMTVNVPGTYEVHFVSYDTNGSYVSKGKAPGVLTVTESDSPIAISLAATVGDIFRDRYGNGVWQNPSTLPVGAKGNFSCPAVPISTMTGPKYSGGPVGGGYGTFTANDGSSVCANAVIAGAIPDTGGTFTLEVVAKPVANNSQIGTMEMVPQEADYSAVNGKYISRSLLTAYMTTYGKYVFGNAWARAYKFTSTLTPKQKPSADGINIGPDLTMFEASQGLLLANESNPTFICPSMDATAAGSSNNVSWGVAGSNPYSEYSSICYSAVHAGAIPISGGKFKVNIGGSGYSSGSTKNGITSYSIRSDVPPPPVFTVVLLTQTLLPTIPTVAGAQSVCPAFSRTLTKGMSGTDVTQLQQFLISKKYLTEGSDTGYYGSQTENAVKKFQIEYGVVKDENTTNPGYGVVGLVTQEKIGKACM